MTPLGVVLTDTAWTMWTKPRAYLLDDVVHVGTQSPSGDIQIDSYDTVEGTSERVVFDSFEPEDHNNPALVIEDGKPVVALYCRHNEDNVLRIQRGNGPVAPSLPAFTGKTVMMSGSTTYLIAFVHDGTIYAMTRSGLYWWEMISSDDWGETWSTPQRLFYQGGTKRLYMAAHLAGDTLRVAMTGMPDSNSPLYYAEVDMVSGDITVPGSATVHGNLDGTDLPILYSTLQEVEVPAVGYYVRPFDVSSGPEPEILWQSWDPDDHTPSTYHYSVYTDGAWVTVDLSETGENYGYSPASNYVGGVQFPLDTPGGEVLVCREVGGVWHIEKAVSKDSGSTWAFYPILDSYTPVVRAHPVVGGEGRHELVFSVVTAFGFDNSYDVFESSLAFTAVPATP